jgi:putative ABC transport system ATP-binding protein
MNTLNLKSLKYSYNNASGKTAVLKDVSAEFHSGKLYAIQGESGSGKTTLLSLLAGLDKIQQGDILYNNKSLNKIGESKFRRKYVNIVFQSFNLIKYMTARENVEVALDFADKTTHEKNKAYKFLDAVGIKKDEADRLILKLSGGQQQRVAIARALASNVPIIVADEPTGNLDEDTEEKIIDIFKSLAHDDNKIIIIVTHSKRVASAADKVLKLSRGVLS